MQIENQTHDADYWARPVSKLTVADVPTDAATFNVEGRQVVGPLQGFGQMWQKTYRIRLTDSPAEPAEVIEKWKQNFQEFWPEGANFYAPITGIAPGEVAVINVSGPVKTSLSTGVMVIYADDESFTFMTPEGHIFAGWITFSAYREEGASVVQAQLLIRANDPLWEIAFRLFASREEDKFWHQTLRNLAAEFGVQGHVQQDTSLVDPRLQWSQAKNVWYNAAIRSALHAPAGLLRRIFGRGTPSSS
jgi:hypothetical protein